ncbi:MAG TPA: DUF2059 domain-containing protein [Phenylobacterium sp.]|nr:DUF2059 domain-containing protein [Phenylobacterium sp.]
MFTAKRLAAGLSAAVLLIAAAPAFCADAAPDGHKLELAKRYFGAIHMDVMMDQMMSRMMPAMSEAMARQSGAALSPDMRKAIDDSVLESQHVMLAKMTEKMIPVVAETFTEKELQDLVTFYEGPTGQAVIAKTPLLTAKMMPTIISLVPEVQADVQRRLCARIDCSKMAPGAPISPRT